MGRAEDFAEARRIYDTNIDEAVEKIYPYTMDKETELSVSEMEIVNIVIIEKVTSASFEDKKEVCNKCAEMIDKIKLVKDAVWLSLYNESVYDIFSRLSRCAREDERQTAWNTLKELYYEMTLCAKKIWKDKNHPERLGVYVSLAKLCKSYLDVADDDSMKLCETYAKEAKFGGKGTLDDDDWKDANKAIDTIKKTIADAIHDKGLLDDDSE